MNIFIADALRWLPELPTLARKYWDSLIVMMRTWGDEVFFPGCDEEFGFEEEIDG